MKNLTETIRTEAENLGIENFEVIKEVCIIIEGREKYQVVPELLAEEVLEDLKNYDGFEAHSFEFDGVTYYFVKM